MNLFARIWHFYHDGFRDMILGKRLWTVILIKLFILFFIFRLFLFPNFLNSRFNDDREKSDYVGKELIDRNQ